MFSIKIGVLSLLVICVFISSIVCVISDSDDSYAVEYTNPSDGLTYDLEIGDPNEASVVAWDSKIKNVVIPSKIVVDNVEYNVSSISATVFAGKDLESVNIGSNVSIPGSSFKGCTGLKSVVIEEGIDTIDASAFSDCTSLKEVAIPNSVKIIGENAFCNTGIVKIDLSHVETIKMGAFKSCSDLSMVLELPSIISLGVSCFESTRIAECIFGSNLQSIGNMAFKSTLIEEFNIPDSFSGSITQNPNSFWWPLSLKAMNFSDNAMYCSVDGVVYTKNMASLVLMPASKTGDCEVLAKPSSIYTIYQSHLDKLSFSSDVSSIPNGSLGNNYFKEVVFPDSITTISRLFKECPQLESVVLPKVTSISSSFMYCPELKELTIPAVKTITTSFIECPNLELKLPDTIENMKIDNIENRKSNNIHIGYYAFNVKSIQFPKELSPSFSITLYNYDTNILRVDPSRLLTISELNGKVVDVVSYMGEHDSLRETMMGYCFYKNGTIYVCPYYTINVEDAILKDEEGNVIAKISYLAGTEITYPVPPKEGYVGVWKKEHQSQDYYIPHYIRAYNVSFVDELDNELMKIEFNEEEGTSMPDIPTKEGYVGMWEEISSNKYKLCYAPILYTAKFVDEAGNTVGETEFTVRDKILDEPEVPVKEGYDGSWTYEIKAGNMVVKPNYVASEENGSEEEDSDNGSNTMIYVAAAVVVVIIAAIAIAYVKRN